MTKTQLEKLGFQHLNGVNWGLLIKPIYLGAPLIIRASTTGVVATISLAIKEGDEPKELPIGNCANRYADLKHLISWCGMTGADIGTYIVEKLISERKQKKK